MCSNGRLDNKDLGTVMQNIKEVSSTVILPSGYYIDYGGAYKDQQQSFKRVTYFNGFVFISFCVLLFLFRNLKVAFILLFISFISGSYLLLFLQIL
jgi:Cu/Ag efflux pump CusA